MSAEQFWSDHVNLTKEILLFTTENWKCEIAKMSWKQNELDVKLSQRQS